MKVLLYSEHLDKIAKSGLGKSIKHQQMALGEVGIQYTTDINDTFDILHINTYFPKSKLFAKQCRKKGIPIVYHAHSTEEDFRQSFHFSNQLAPIFKQWLISCYKLGDIIVTPTDYSKRILDTYAINRDIVAISNGVQLEKFKAIPNVRSIFRNKYHVTDESFLIIGIGLYLERKGILDFIELAKRFPDTKFIWFGYTNFNLIPDHVRKAIQNPPENLIFAGYVDNQEIIEAMQACDLYLFPTFEETEGIPAIEACASKTNFIVRDIPVFEGWLEHGKNVYKAKNIDEFERLIQGFKANEMPSLVDEAYAIAEERDIKAIGLKLAKVYQTILNNKNRLKKNNLIKMILNR